MGLLYVKLILKVEFPFLTLSTFPGNFTPNSSNANLRGTRVLPAPNLHEMVSISVFLTIAGFVWIYVTLCTTYFTHVPKHALRDTVSSVGARSNQSTVTRRRIDGPIDFPDAPTAFAENQVTFAD